LRVPSDAAHPIDDLGGHSDALRIFEHHRTNPNGHGEKMHPHRDQITDPHRASVGALSTESGAVHPAVSASRSVPSRPCVGGTPKRCSTLGAISIRCPRLSRSRQTPGPAARTKPEAECVPGRGSRFVPSTRPIRGEVTLWNGALSSHATTMSG